MPESQQWTQENVNFLLLFFRGIGQQKEGREIATSVNNYYSIILCYNYFVSKAQRSILSELFFHAYCNVLSKKNVS